MGTGRHLAGLLLAVLLLLPVHVGAGSWQPLVSGAMVDRMWDLMAWFSGRDGYREPRWGVSPFPPSDYSYRPGSGAGVSLQGVWLAPSGEYWVVRQGRFVLIQPWGAATHGEYLREGNFLRVFGPWGERRFELSLIGGMLVLRDTQGQITMLQRVQAADWYW